MDLSGRMEKSPCRHLPELYYSLLLGDQSREDENCEICAIHGAHENCKENFYWNILRNSFGIPMHT